MRFWLWDLEILQALAWRLILAPGFLGLEASLWSSHCFALKILSLVPFSLWNRLSISLVAKPSPLDLASGPLGPVWSHTLLRIILQGSLGIQAFTRILRPRNLHHKIQTLNLNLEIPLKPFLESFQPCLLKQASHIFKPLFWISFWDHLSSYHWYIHYSDPYYTRSTPIRESM